MIFTMKVHVRSQFKIGTLILISLTVFSFASCNKPLSVVTKQDNRKAAVEEQLAQFIPESELYSAADFSIPRWIPGDYPRIAILFGHGYTKEGAETAERERIIAALDTQFGLEENNGLVVPLVFDASYIDGKAIRLAFITELLKDYNLEGLIVVAAPERTHAALNRLVDSGATYPIYSVFPQDENLETEGASTFVLDFSRQVMFTDTEDAVLALTPEEQRLYTGDMAHVLISVVQTMKNRNKSSIEGETVGAQMTAIVSMLQKEMEKQDDFCSIVPFLDPETGIRAQNHYVLVLKE